MKALVENLQELKPFQLRERANLLDIQIQHHMAQVAELRELKAQIREEQAQRKADVSQD